MFWKLIENAVQDASSEWTTKWLEGEKSLFEKILKPNEDDKEISKDDFTRWKSQILALLNEVTVEEMKNHCINAKPEFEEQFNTEKAETIFKKELTDFKEFIQTL